jgi:hypothetical protein
VGHLVAHVLLTLPAWLVLLVVGGLVLAECALFVTFVALAWRIRARRDERHANNSTPPS